MSLRSALYAAARILGDARAISSGRAGQRASNRIFGRLLGRLLRDLLKF